MEFPYEKYPWQEQIIQALEMSNKKFVILESPTGSGKTIVSLFYALSKFRDKKIVYLTRTNSQAENLLREARSLNADKVIQFQGRGEMCLYRQRAPEMSQGDPSEQAQYCRNLVERQKKSGDGCPYNTEYTEGWKKEIFSQGDFLELGNLDFCPYFAQKGLLEEARVVVTTYSYFLNPFIRERFLEWMNVFPSEIVLIADESHNIPDLTREHFSLKFSLNSLRNCRKEIDQYGDLLLRNVNISFIVDSLEESVLNLLKEGDRILTPEDIREEFMNTFQMNSLEIKNYLMALANYGLSIKESKEIENKLPRSFIFNSATTALKLMEEDDSYSVRIARNDEPSGISILYLETYKMLEFLKGMHKVIFLSGTISPISKFKDEIGIEESDDIIVRTDYLENNLRVIFTDDVTSRYSEKDENSQIMKRYIKTIVEKIDRNTVIFCTSYDQIDSFLEMDLKGKIYFERKGMSNEDFLKLLNSFKEKGGKLFAVINGRLSEGLDLPGKLLEVAVIAGIPYPRPSPETSAIELFYDMKFKRGWEYAYEAVAATRIRQAIGRLIRSPKDRGVAIVLDSRIRKFKRYLPNLYLSKDVIGNALEFLQIDATENLLPGNIGESNFSG